MVFCGSAIAQKDTSLLPQDYKCGISIRYSGTEGIDWIAEEMYHDPIVTSRRTVYIRDTTDISLFHNSLNSRASGIGGSLQQIGAAGPDGISGNADDGIIRYKIDGDMNSTALWADRNTTPRRFPTRPLLTAYTTPFAFEDLTYAPFASEVKVLGTTGGNGQPISSRTDYYHYGILDSVRDEWHSMAIGDDDWAGWAGPAGAKEAFWSSDGREQLFVLNPKTPCITVAKSGNAQFYTTPAKAYFIPKIHNQTTYIQPGTGSISVILTSLYGKDVHYRINGGSFTDAEAAKVVLDASDFSTGNNLLECYYEGNEDIVRTRTIVKNPPFPSAGESHGNLMWKDSIEFNKIAARLTTPTYSWYWNKIRTDRDSNFQRYWDLYGWQGLRKPWIGVHPSAGTKAFENAFIALVKGWDSRHSSGAAKTYAQYAKEMLLDNVLDLDTVGAELNPSADPSPCTENRGGGYYVVNNNFGYVPGYDLLIAHYRSDQHASGLTPIEDHFIRDKIAGFANSKVSGYASGGPGMWATAEAAGVLMGGIAMPNYNTNYYGTSGYNGITTATHLWTPFPTVPETWKQIFTDLVHATGTFPDRAWDYGPDRPDKDYDLLGNEGAGYGFFDGPNLGYWNLMQPSYLVLTNLSALHTTREWPVIQKAYLYSVKGEMRGSLGTGPIAEYRQLLQALNYRHPIVEGPGRQALIERGSAQINTINSLIWFDDGSVTKNPTAPTNLRTLSR